MNIISRLKLYIKCVDSMISCEEFSFTDQEKKYWLKTIYQTEMTIKRLEKRLPVTEDYLRLIYELYVS